MKGILMLIVSAVLMLTALAIQCVTCNFTGLEILLLVVGALLLFKADEVMENEKN